MRNERCKKEGGNGGDGGGGGGWPAHNIIAHNNVLCTEVAGSFLTCFLYWRIVYEVLRVYWFFGMICFAL